MFLSPFVPLCDPASTAKEPSSLCVTMGREATGIHLNFNIFETSAIDRSTSLPCRGSSHRFLLLPSNIRTYVFRTLFVRLSADSWTSTSSVREKFESAVVKIRAAGYLTCPIMFDSSNVRHIARFFGFICRIHSLNANSFDK